jgi:long-subunit fatty acid transport protein
MVRTWIKSWIIIIGIVLISSSTVFSQNRTNSPYSLYGVGLVNNIFDAKSAGMGGIAFGMREDANVNFSNPASYTALSPKSFTFNAGMYASTGSLASVTGTDKVSNATMNYLMFGFQVTKGWNTSMGLVPYSNSEFNYGALIEDDVLGQQAQTSVGSGGINKFFWGNAFQLTKNLSVGVNAGFLFGSINKESQRIFIDTTTFLNTSVVKDIIVKDFEFSFGVQYQKQLKNELMLTVGAVFSPKVNIKAERDYLVRSFSQTAIGVDFYQDTIIMENDTKGNLVLPTKFGAGLMLEKPGKWRAGLDIEMENWSEYREYGVADSLNNSFRIALGGEYIPDRNNVYSYFKRMAYRAGMYYEKSNLTLRNNQINEYGISFGVGLPMKRSKSGFNLAVEIGQRGTTSANLIKEKYIRFRLGISLHQRWFEQRKYY